MVGKGGCRLGRLAGSELAHRRAVEFEPIGVVDNAIRDRVAEGGLADNFMSGCHGELAGDEDGAAAVAILDDLHEIAPLAGPEAIWSPIVEDEEIDPDKHPKQPREAAITVSEIAIGKQAPDGRVVDRVTERLCSGTRLACYRNRPWLPPCYHVSGGRTPSSRTSRINVRPSARTVSNGAPFALVPGLLFLRLWSSRISGAHRHR
jgi:hypothetical protein